MSTPPVPAPSIALASDFPAPSDRSAGTFNAKAVDWASSARTMASNMHAAAVATATNATSAQENAQSASAAELAANQSAAAADQSASTAGGYASTAQAARNQAVKLNLGAHASAPTTDIDGHPILTGATYFDITLDKWRVWTGTGWGAGVSAIAGVSSFGGLAGDIELTDVLPAFTGNAKKVLAVNAQEDGLEFVPSLENGYQEFTTSGTWTRPANATWAYVECVGGGAGGPSGRVYWFVYTNAMATVTSQSFPGSYTPPKLGVLTQGRLFRLDDLPPSGVVTVGAGGRGGVGPAASSIGPSVRANSVAGFDGGNTVFLGAEYLSSHGGYPLNTASACLSAPVAAGGVASAAITYHNDALSQHEVTVTNGGNGAAKAGGLPATGGTSAGRYVGISSASVQGDDGQDGAGFASGAGGGIAAVLAGLPMQSGGQMPPAMSGATLTIVGGKGGKGGGYGCPGGPGGSAVGIYASRASITNNNTITLTAGDGGEGGDGVVRIWYW